MATLLNPLDTVQASISRGEAVHDIFLDNWTTPFEEYPPDDGPGFPATVAGLSIGPRSDVDRAWITWNPGPQVLNGASGTAISAYIRTLSVDSPLLFPQGAGKGSSFTGIFEAMGKGLLKVFSSSLVGFTFPFNSQFGRIESTGLSDFIVPDPLLFTSGQVSDFPIYVQPRLHLQLILRQEGILQATKRAPFHYTAGPQALVSPGIFAKVALLPTYGRKTITIVMSSDAATGGRFAITALRGLGGVVGPWSIPIQASIEGDKTGAQSTAVRFQLCSPCADYIGLYYMGDAGNVQFTVAAYD